MSQAWTPKIYDRSPPLNRTERETRTDHNNHVFLRMVVKVIDDVGKSPVTPVSIVRPVEILPHVINITPLDFLPNNN